MVDIRVKSGFDDIAFPDRDRGLIDDRTLQETGELGKILDFFAIAGKRTRFRAFFCRILSGGGFSRGGKLSDVGKKTGFGKKIGAAFRLFLQNIFYQWILVQWILVLLNQVP